MAKPETTFSNEAAEMTTAPLAAPPRVIAVPIDPEFIRLPKAGDRCPITGLSRSALNQLILACPANDFKPPVKSFVLRQRGARTGIRLIDHKSLVDHIRAHPQEAA
jgi:hypothetical protein